MAGDVFLKVSGIKGESIDSKHPEEIEIISWNWGASGSGFGANYQVRDLTVVKYMDRSSPTLFNACLTQKVIKEIQLTNRKSGSVPLEYMVLTLSACNVSSVDTHSSEDYPTETVCFRFAKFKQEYTPQNPDGSGAGKITAEFDLENPE